MGEIGMVLFKKKIENYLQDYLNDYEGFSDCSIDVRDMPKENRTRAAVIVRKADSGVAPTIYLDNYYEKFVAAGNIAMEQILEEIAAAAVEGYRNYPEFDIENIFNPKEDIICELVNTQLNRHLLRNVPHRNIEDLSLIYRKKVYVPEADSATVLITNDVADRMGMDEQELYDTAMATEQYICESMAYMIAELMGVEPEELEMDDAPEMYVITNDSKMYGATAMLNNEILAKAMEEMGADDVIVLPSSIHEIIVVPGYMDSDYMRNMVREVNRTQVQEQERLSDNVYRYDKENGLKLIRSKEQDKEYIREETEPER